MKWGLCMLIKGAFVKEKGSIHLEELEIDQPKADEVLIKMVGTGICHTDFSVSNQEIPSPLPIVLGHEGAGIIEEIGESVTDFEIGDHVVIAFAFCNECTPCVNGRPSACEKLGELNFDGTMLDGTTRLSKDGESVATLFGQSSLATHAIANQMHLVKIDKDVDLSIMGPLACGLQTGAGTILNKLQPEFGSSIAIFGCGGVGLSAIMAAKMQACENIIAVDVNDERLELAKELGATHIFNGKETEDIVSEIKAITHGGAQYSFDTTAVPPVILQALRCLAVEGTMAVVGVGGEVPIHIHEDLVMPNRTIVGITEGVAVPNVFIPQLINYHKQGRFPFDKLIKKYPFSDLSTALEDMESGKTIKPVVIFD